MIDAPWTIPATADRTVAAVGQGLVENDALRRIKYRHLRCLIELADRGKVTAAANALNITQPAVSKTIRELEDILLIRLFERDGPIFRLTSHGRTFRRHAEASIGALDDGVRATWDSSEAALADVTIGALSSVAAAFLPDVVLAFDSNEAPLLRVISGPNTYLLAVLLAGEMDMVVGSMPDRSRMSGLKFEYLYTDRIIFMVRTDHPLAGRGSVDLRMIAEHTVLIPTVACNLRLALDTALNSRDVGGLGRIIEAASPEFARGYVRKSDAIWAASGGAAMEEMASGRLVALKLEAGYFPIPVGVTMRRSAKTSASVERLLECMRDVARSRPAD